VQERALRFVYDDYTSSYINLLEKAQAPSLQNRCIRTMAMETYKVVNKLDPVCLHDLVNMKNSIYAFRYSNILDVPQVRTTRYGKKSFMFAAATLWNDLPNHFRTENSFNHFKSLIQSWNGCPHLLLHGTGLANDICVPRILMSFHYSTYFSSAFSISFH
jgi:hypothetical protein